MIKNYKNPVSVLKNQFHFQCSICLEQFNDKDRYPMIICPSQHSVCKTCTENIVFPQQNSRCPQCRLEISKKNMIQFRHLDKIRKTSQKLRHQGSKIKKQITNLVRKQNNLLEQLREQKQKNQWLVKQIQQKQRQINKLVMQKNNDKQIIDTLQVRIEHMIAQNQKLKLENKAQPKQLKQKKWEQNVKINDFLNKQMKNTNDLLKEDQVPKLKVIQNRQSMQRSAENNLKASDIQKQKVDNEIANNWVDEKCHDYRQLSLQGNIITAKAQVLIFSRKQMQKKTQFCVKILKMKNWIGVGIVDSRFKRMPTLGGISNLVLYASRGKVWISGRNVAKGQGFKKNQELTVSVDFQFGVIQWLANKQQRQRIKCHLLHNPSIAWVPLIYMSDQGDSVTIVD